MSAAAFCARARAIAFMRSIAAGAVEVFEATL